MGGIVSLSQGFEHSLQFGGEGGDEGLTLAGARQGERQARGMQEVTVERQSGFTPAIDRIANDGTLEDVR